MTNCCDTRVTTPTPESTATTATPATPARTARTTTTAGTGRAATTGASSETLVGWLAGFSEKSGWLVDFAGNPHGPLPARTTLAMSREAMATAAASQLEALLCLNNRARDTQPIVIGLLQPSLHTPMLDALLGQEASAARPDTDLDTNPEVEAKADTDRDAEPDTDTDLGREGETEARIDGRRVVLEGADEVVLRCGAASITLRANGKVVIRGLYIESDATGTNRMKGGAVRIN